MSEDKRPYYGRDRRESKDRRASRSLDHRRVRALLPHPSVLEEYEEVSPGSSGRIVHMAEAELAHRHDWEERYVQEYMRLYRLGQMFGFVLSLVIIGASFALFMRGEWLGAVVIAGGGFGSLTMASLAAAVRHRFGRRPRR